MKVILFDIDGTLIRTRGAGRRACNHAFESHFSVRESWDDVCPHGRTDPLIFNDVARRAIGRELEPSELRRLEETYCEQLEREITNGDPPLVLPGVLPLLERMAARDDVVLGIQTGNFERSAMMKLRAANLDCFFRFGGFAQDAGARETIVARACQLAHRHLPEPDRAEFYVIGDTPHDIDAGKHHRCRTIGVATGIHSTADLAAHGADIVFDDLSDYAALFDFLFS